MAEPFKVDVECYAGYRGEETPRRFRIGTRNIQISQILDRWLGPDHRYFKVMVEDQAIYILRHDTTAEEWELTFFEVRR